MLISSSWKKRYLRHSGSLLALTRRLGHKILLRLRRRVAKACRSFLFFFLRFIWPNHNHKGFLTDRECHGNLIIIVHQKSTSNKRIYIWVQEVLLRRHFTDMLQLTSRRVFFCYTIMVKTFLKRWRIFRCFCTITYIIFSLMLCCAYEEMMLKCVWKTCLYSVYPGALGALPWEKSSSQKSS